MTEPTTSTGKRLWEKANSNKPGAIYLAGLGLDHILAIESEAAQQGRERLRERVETYISLALLAPRPGVVPSANEARALAGRIFRLACLDVDADLTDPEDDR